MSGPGGRSKLSPERVSHSLGPLCPPPFTGTLLATARPPAMTSLEREGPMLKKDIRTSEWQERPEAAESAWNPISGAIQNREPRAVGALFPALGQSEPPSTERA